MNIVKETVARVYGIDIDNMDVDVEYDVGNGSDGTFSSEYVYITDKSSGIEYSAAVDMQSATVYYVEKIWMITLHLQNLKISHFMNKKL